jgi:hypothetical protein
MKIRAPLTYAYLNWIPKAWDSSVDVILRDKIVKWHLWLMRTLASRSRCRDCESLAKLGCDKIRILSNCFFQKCLDGKLAAQFLASPGGLWCQNERLSDWTRTQLNPVVPLQDYLPEFDLREVPTTVSKLSPSMGRVFFMSDNDSTLLKTMPEC